MIWRLWLWRATAAVALAAAVLGLATSQALRPTENDTLGPPYHEPEAADVLPIAAQLNDAFDRSFILMAAGPPQVALFQSNSPVAGELRRNAIDGAWEVEYLTPDGLSWVHATVVRSIWSSFAEGMSGWTCEGDPAPGGDVPVRSETRRVTNSVLVLCAEFFRGASLVQLEAALPADDVAAVDSETASFDRVLSAVYEATPNTFREAPARVSFQNTRVVILQGWWLSLLVLSIMSWLPALLLDRSTWQRLVSRLRRGTRRGPHFDLEAESRPVAARGAAVLLLQFSALVWTLRLTEQLNLDGLWSGVVLATAFIATALGTQLLLRAAPRRRSEMRFTPAGIAVVYLGAGLTAGVVALAAFLWFVGTSYDTWGWVPSSTEWGVARFGGTVEVVAVALLLLAFIPLALARRVAARLRLNDPTGVHQGHVLLLRYFSDDGLHVRSRQSGRRGLVDQLAFRRWERFEEIIARSLSAYGPTLTVGAPDELLPPELGAQRLVFSDDAWQEHVTDLMNGSALVVAMIGRTPSLLWEIDTLRHSGLLHKTIFIVPPTGARERRRRLAVLAAALNVPWAWFETERTARVAVAVCFPGATDLPLVMVARGGDDISYETAIRLGAQLIDGTLTAPLTGIPARDGIRRARPAPTIETAAAGEVPLGTALRRWLFSSWWFWMLALGASLVLVIGVALYAFASPASVNPGRTVLLHDPTLQRITLGGLDAGRVIAVAGSRVFAVPAGGGQPEPIVDIGKGVVTAAQVQDGILVYLMFDQARLGSVDLATGKVLWETDVSPGTREFEMTNDGVLLASPATREVKRLSLVDGSTRATVKLDGMPWSIVVNGDRVEVALIDRDEIVDLSPIDLTELVRHRTIRSPRELVVAGGNLWVQSSVENAVSRAADPLGVDTIWTRSRFPALAAASTGPVVEGWEDLTVYSPAGPQRILTDGEPVRGVTVSDDRLVVAQDGEIWSVALAPTVGRSTNALSSPMDLSPR